MTNYIWIKTQFEGIHKYPNAPKDVKFLRFEHRHIFYVKVWIEIYNNDRDIEFIKFKRFINTLIKENNLNFKSCEMISDDIYKSINKEFPKRNVKISISEDNENGSEKEYNMVTIGTT